MDNPNTPLKDAPAQPLRGRCGVVAVVGRTNAGKSTLLNRLLGEKVSIVSPVVQTTRNIIRAVYNDPRGQIVLLDTPGLHASKSPLGTLMNRMSTGTVSDVDLALLLADAARPPRAEDERLIRRLAEASIPVVFALNKCDLPGFDPLPFRRHLREVAAEKGTEAEFLLVETSATTGKGAEALLAAMFSRLPEGPPLFDEDTLTDYPKRLAIADVVREKFYAFLRDELPHDLGVCVDTLEETPGGWKIAVDLYVERPSQKPILLGEKGRNLRKVRRQAEPELREIFDTPVTLRLWVKVEHHWKRNFWLLRKMGYAGF